MNSKMKLISISLCLLSIFNLCSAQSGLFGTVSTANTALGATTRLNFQLYIQGQFVQTGDYLSIILPQGQGVQFTQTASCVIQNTSLTVSLCQIVSQTEARIYFGSVSTIETTINGSIGQFTNPSSTVVISPIKINLFSSQGIGKTTALNASLSGFQTTSLTVSLSSSSQTVGAISQTLSISVTSSYVIKAIGSIILTVPDYYTNSGSDTYFDPTKLVCSGSEMTISSCQYLSQSKQLTIKYSFTNGQDRTNLVVIKVQGFRNPVKPSSQGGFFLSSLDSNNYTIGVSQEVFLAGITTPQQLGFATVGFDGTAAIGKYSNLKLNIGTSQSLGPNCFIQIVFPPEFTVDNTLTAIDGTGFFTGTSIVNIAQANRIVTLSGCKSVYGSAPQQGSLTFRQIQNPTFVTDTSSFQVFMGVDTSFSLGTLIAAQISGIIVPKSFFTPGPISNIQITPQDATYGALTSYNFNFTPNSNLNSKTGTQITIDFPTSLKFTQNYCAITSRSDNISQSTTCTLSGNQVLLNYVFSNKPTFAGGTPIYLQIYGIQNPTSQFNLGDFKISTYMQINSVFQLVDQGTNNNPVTAAAGVVTKTREITSTSVIANDQNVTYTFSMKFTNTIPIGGQIKVTFDSSTSVYNSALMNNSCYRLDFSNKPTSLTCQATTKTIIITVSTPAFSANGLVAGDEFRLQVAPVNNRRDIFADSSFIIQSFDTQGNQIDKSSDPSIFTLRMTQPSKFGDMQVSFDNQINGAVNATYTFNFASNLQIDQNNMISIQFPKQIGLQTTGQISCSGDPRLIKQLNCYQTQSDTIIVQMNQLSISIMPGDAFFVKIPQIRNPYSNAPTDQFGSVSLLDGYNRIIATGLNNPVTIKTSIVSQIQISSLTQSNKDPGMIAVYTLTFQTNNPIPSGAVMQVTTPTAVSFYQDSSGCSVTTTSFKSNVCRFVDSSVLQIRNVFSGQTSDYTGQVSISFNAYNPPDNRQASISLQLFIFTDTSFTYQIDQIFGGLNPNTKCTYPCLTCDAATPDNCTSCPIGNSDPQFLQTNINGTKTCKYNCDSGYTFDKSINKNCLACDKSCLTCRNGGNFDDSKSCITCAPSYPYFWVEFAQCFDSKTKCPVGSYEYAKQKCSSCPKECVSCNSPYDCTTCDPKSATPLRQSGQCVNKCMSSRTPVFINGYNECQQCDPSCLECQEGKPTYCKTCRTDKTMFLFGSACLTSCPAGTTQNFAKMTCISCPSGCSQCDVQNPSTCLICEEGLVFKDNKCITECPPQQVKSSDGSVCEDRVYPLNIRYVPFPFCFTAAVLLAISFISWLITERTTLVNQTFIVLLAILIHIMIFFEIIKGITDHQTTYVAVPIVLLIIHLVLNVAFTLTFIFKEEDFQYTEYRDQNRKLFAAIILLTIFFSFHIIRITWSKVFLIKGFKGSATNPTQFIKPLVFYSRLHVLVVLVPLVLLNGIGAAVAKVGWGTNQLQMTMVEICLLSVVFASCVAIEQYIQKPRVMLYKPSDENKLFSGIFTKRGLAAVGAIPDESDQKDESEVVGDSAFWPLQEKNFRFERLEEVIRAVKCYKDIKLNNCFDKIMDVEMGDLPGRRCDTDFEPQYPLPLEMDLDQQLERSRIPIPKNQDFNNSFPGLNESYDGNLKRIELLEYFEKQAIEDAENERRFIDKLAKKNRTKDKEVMYDAAFIDNCFFAPKTKADNVTQTINDMKEQGIDPMDLIPYTGRKEPDTEAKVPNFEDTLISLMKEDKNIQVDASDLKQKLTNNAEIPHSLDVGGPQEHILNTAREQTKFGIEQDEDELESFKSASSFKSGESETSNETVAQLELSDQESIYVSEETVVDRKPDKEMWLRQADYLKTIILADIEIARQLKEPYKGLNVKNETQVERGGGDLTERTISQKKKKKRDVNNEEQTKLSMNSQEKIEESIKEEDYDQIDALFYKNNFPNDSNYTVSSIHTSQLESIPADKSHKDDFTAWMRETVEINQRTFNVFEVIGNFKLDASGNIEDRDRTIIDSNFLDRDGFLVNEKGYLINEVTGAIRSRFTYDDLFMPEVGTMEDLGELPMPYRLEKFNFNPHRIMGSFDYDNGKPVFLKNKYNNFTDKHYRPVNQCGFLINEREDIIDADGHVKFIRQQLTPKGNLPAMYPYKGEPFAVADIIGRFKKDDSSKEIILKFDSVKGRATDEDGKLVNAVGYLIDQKGNIVDKKGQIKFNFWEILFNEPPKIFSFTEFSLNWIKGALDRDVTLNPLHNDEFDLMGRRINTLGYLINKEESIVDQHGKEVFKNEILTQYFGQDAQIPEVYRNGKLRKPLNWSNVQDQDWKLPDYKKLISFKASTDKQSNDETAMPSDYFSKEISLDTKKDITVSIDLVSKNASNHSTLSNQKILTTPYSQNALINLNIGNFPSNKLLNNKSPLTSDDKAQLPMQTEEKVQTKKKRAKSSKHRPIEKPKHDRNERPGLKVLQLYSQQLDGTQIAPNFGNSNQRSHQKLRNVPRLKRNNLMKMNDSYADQAEQIFANDGFDPLQLAEDMLTRGKGRNQKSKTQMQQMNDAYGKKK